MTMFNPDEFLNSVLSGGGGTTTKTPEKESWLATYSPTQLRYAYRAGQIDENEWQAELVARGETVQSAKAEIEKQKTVGVSTAAKTKGQLTAAEQNGVDALARTGAPAGRPQLYDSWESPANAKAGISTVSGEPMGQNGAGSGAVGPGGRTLAQVKGTEYVNDAERAWYLSETAKGGSSGSSTGSTAARSTSSGAGGSTASGGSRVAATSATDKAGSTFSVKGADGITDNWREFTRADGSTYYRNLQTNDVSDLLPRAQAEKPPPVKKSPGLQQAEQAGKILTTLNGGNAGVFDDPTAAPQPMPTSLTQKLAAQFAYGPSAAGQAPHASQVDVATDDMGGRMHLPSSGQNLGTGIAGAAHLKGTGDPETDLVNALAVLAKRDTYLAQNPGVSPLEYSQMVDQLAASQSNPLGGRANFNTGYVAPNTTGNITAGGKMAIDDTSADERAFLNPEDYMANGDANFRTSAPIGFMNMWTGEMEGMAGGTGKEKISVEPVGPHGTPAQEAQVGSRMWPEMMGVKTYANGLDDLMRDYGGNPNAQIEVDYKPNMAPTSVDTPAPAPYQAAMPKTGDADVAGSQGPDFGGGFPGTPAHNKIDLPYLYPMNPYMEELIIAPLLEKMLKKAGFPGTTASLLNAPASVRSQVLGPRALEYVNARATPGQWQDQMGPMYDWMSEYFNTRPHNGRDMYQPMADGGSGYAGHPGEADNGGMSDLSKVFQLQDLDNAGVFDLARLGWESGFMTPNMQARLWATQSLPGNGNPIGGNSFLPGMTYPGLSGYGGNVPLASLYNTNAAQLTTDTYRELGNQVNPNATRSLGLEAPMTQAQIMRTPIKTLMTQGANANPAPMADGGMGTAGVDPMAMAPPQTDFSMLLETLLGPKNKAGRKPMLRPVGSTMGAAA